MYHQSCVSLCERVVRLHSAAVGHVVEVGGNYTGYAASGSADGTCLVWNVFAPSSSPRLLQGHVGSITSLLGCLEGNHSSSSRVASDPSVATLPIRRDERDERDESGAMDSEKEKMRTLSSPPPPTHSLGSYPRSVVASGGADRTLRLWRPAASASTPDPDPDPDPDAVAGSDTDALVCGSEEKRRRQNSQPTPWECAWVLKGERVCGCGCGCGCGCVSHVCVCVCVCV